MPDLQSGRVAELCGVSPDTIRHYERRGLIAGVRRANGYRLFPAATVDRVLLVRRALAIGFTLDELVKILRQRDAGSAPCRGVRALAAEKLAALDQRIAELTAMREELTRVVEEWDVRLAATAEGEPARLLETGLPTGDARERSGAPPFPHGRKGEHR